MLHPSLKSLALLAALLLSPAARTEAAAPATEQPKADVKDVYYVSGGQCRRSWQILGTYKTVGLACLAAEKFRNEQKLTVEVSTGSKPVLKPSLLKASRFEVCVPDCKTTWLPKATFGDLARAQKLASDLKRAGGEAEVVFHFPAK